MGSQGSYAGSTRLIYSVLYCTLSHSGEPCPRTREIRANCQRSRAEAGLDGAVVVGLGSLDLQFP